MSMEARHNMKIIEKIYNVETGEETITERDETAEETEARLKSEAELAEYEILAEAKAKAKASAEAKLVALGLELDDLKALGL